MARIRLFSLQAVYLVGLGVGAGQWAGPGGARGREICRGSPRIVQMGYSPGSLNRFIAIPDKPDLLMEFVAFVIEPLVTRPRNVKTGKLSMIKSCGAASLAASSFAPLAQSSNDADVVEFAWYHKPRQSLEISQMHSPPSIESPSSIAFSIYGLSAKGSSAIVRAALTSSCATYRMPSA